ncbi:MAG TPA: glycosyltransferase [Gryllotalpicola sp.]
MSDQHLRVVIVSLNYAPERTGIARYTSSLAQGLAKRGHQVQVITTHPHYPEWKIHPGYGQWRRDEIVDGVPVRRLRHFVPRRPSWIPRALGELSFGLRALFTRWGRPDVVVLPSPALFASSLVLLRARLFSRAAATVVWVQDLYSLGASETQGSGGSLVAALARVESATLRGADGVALIHARFRDRVVASLGVEPQKAGVIRNWTSVVAVDRAIDRDAVRLRLGWAPDELVLMHTGNMGVKQGLENIVEMARLAEAIQLSVRVVFTGGGSQKDRLVAQAAPLSNVVFLDSLPDGEFEEVLNCADVLLLNEKPGVAEMAVPSKLTTYFSTGLPVVAATDAASISAAELSVSGGGIRVDPGDPAALLEAVSRLRADSALRARLGMAGLAFRDAYLTEDAAIDSYEEWLQSLVESRAHTHS